MDSVCKEKLHLTINMSKNFYLVLKAQKIKFFFFKHCAIMTWRLAGIEGHAAIDKHQVKTHRAGTSSLLSFFSPFTSTQDDKIVVAELCKGYDVVNRAGSRSIASPCSSISCCPTQSSD